MTSYQDGEYAVYLYRPWFNHSKDDFSAWTITVTAYYGVILIAVLALLVRVAGEALWTITAYTLHQFRARDEPQTGLFRQFQVILRNPPSSLASVLEIVSAGHVSRKKAERARRKAFGLALWPLGIFASFTAAGILVAKVAIPAYEANQVLLKPSTCGLPTYNNPHPTYVRIQRKFSDDIRQSRAYANRCFGSVNKTLGCSSLPAQQLPYTTTLDAQCPFGNENQCVLGKNGAVRLDTGLLDSHEYLGINAKKEDRVLFEIVSTCSVFHTTDYIAMIPNPYTNATQKTTNILRVSLGSVGSQNFTWEYDTVRVPQNIAYTIHPFTYNAGQNKSSAGWMPIADMDFEDADTSIAFLAFNKVLFTEPVFDPMYSANGTYPLTAKDGITYYEPDYYFRTIACVDQMRICKDKSTCSPLTGMTVLDLNALNLNDKQFATAQRILFARWASHTYSVIFGQGPSALSAYDSLYDRWSGSLPADQWVTEVTKWFQTGLANIQHRIVEFPNNEWGRGDYDPMFFQSAESLNYTGAQAMKDLCQSQLVRSTAQYQSFSMAGLLIVIIVSCAIIITSWTLDWCVSRRKDRQPGGTNRHKRLAWIADGKLQLLRASFENVGHGGWSTEAKAIPCREPYDKKDMQAIVEERRSDSGSIRPQYPPPNNGVLEQNQHPQPYQDQPFSQMVGNPPGTNEQQYFAGVPLPSSSPAPQTNGASPLLPQRQTGYGRGRVGSEPYNTGYVGGYYP